MSTNTFSLKEEARVTHPTRWDGSGLPCKVFSDVSVWGRCVGNVDGKGDVVYAACEVTALLTESGPSPESENEVLQDVGEADAKPRGTTTIAVGNLGSHRVHTFPNIIL